VVSPPDSRRTEPRKHAIGKCGSTTPADLVSATRGSKEVDDMAGATTTHDETATRTTSVNPRNHGSSRRLGWIVTLSLATGLLAAFLIALLPIVPVEENAIAGAVMLGLAVGWTVLWRLSLRSSDHPQRWAVVPAVFTGVGGLLMVAFGSALPEAFSWVWPPVLVVLVFWMLRRTRKEMPGRSGRLQLYVVCGFLALSAVGGGYQAVGEATDPTVMPSTGRLIDVDGHRLYLNCVGSGSPTVVLEPGAGATSSHMGWIAPALARSIRVCVYDRAGRGWSEPADTPQDGARIATDLHTLVHRAGEVGPYVLAGHSFGGLYVRIFAAHYPDEVAGLVLVDSTDAKEPAKSVIPTAAPASSEPATGRVPVLATLAARVGLTRLLGRLDLGSLPPHSRDEARASVAQSTWVRSSVDEYMRGSASMQEAASLRDFGDKPLMVVTAGDHPASWMSAQAKTLTLSTNSMQQIVEGATHTDLILEEEYADVSTQAILDVVNAVRNDRPLSR
jgi:pimeloyl-ACP methyl ester carboxylesterase